LVACYKGEDMEQRNTIRTYFHQIAFDKIGAEITALETHGQEDGQWSYVDLLALADLLEHNRVYLEQQAEAQTNTLRRVASEIIDHLEEQEPGSSAKATPYQVDEGRDWLCGCRTEQDRKVFDQVCRKELGPEHLPSVTSFAGQWYLSTVKRAIEDFDNYHEYTRQKDLLYLIFCQEVKKRYPEAYAEARGEKVS
jgi:hypothetical protein